PQLGREVFVHAAVPVQMVGRQVEHRRDMRVERRRMLELEARNLGDDEIVRLAADRVAQRVAEVTAGERPSAGRFEDRTDQAYGRALSVGSGNRHQRSSETVGGKLDLRSN